MRMNSNNGGVQMTNSSVTGVDKRSIDEITRFFVVSIHSKIHRGILKQNESLPGANLQRQRCTGTHLRFR